MQLETLHQSESRGANEGYQGRWQGADDDGDIELVSEEEWDNINIDPMGVTLDYHTKEENRRRLAFTPKMARLRAPSGQDWFFQKVFGDGEFIAAGQLVIPPGKKKPSKGTKDNSYVFYIIDGTANVKIHNTTFVLGTGAMFVIPRGNTYSIENITDRDAKFFFTQARKVAFDDIAGGTQMNVENPKPNHQGDVGMDIPPALDSSFASMSI